MDVPALDMHVTYGVVQGEVVIANMMIHSLSPQGRRLVEQMYTEDPFTIDVRLDSDSRNRSAEIANTFLKAIGRRLKFKKVRKNIVSPISFNRDPVKYPISFIPEELREGFDYEKDFKDRQKLKASKESKSPFIFDGRSRRRTE